MSALLIAPVGLPLLSAALTLLLSARPRWQARLALSTVLAILAASIALLVEVRHRGILAVWLGGWPPPFGVALVVDLFSAAMLVVTGIVGTAALLFARSSGSDRAGAYFYPMALVLLTGVCGALLTADLFNLYVWFEVMLIGSFVLLLIEGKPGQIAGVLKYLLVNLVGSALFLAGLGLIYGVYGTLNLADLARIVRGGEEPFAQAPAMLLLVAFGIKAAVFPLFFWLPASYPAAPAALTALFSGLLTKVGVYAMIRLFTLVFVQESSFFPQLILVVSIFTMLVGVAGAMVQRQVQHILSFHIVSQIGYMILGLGLFTQHGIAASIYYLMHNMVVKANLFLVGGAAFALQGSYRLSELSGLARRAPALAMVFLISALSLSGVPPLSGFFAKLGIVQAGMEQGEYLAVAAALAAGLLTLYSMNKIWKEAYWGPQKRWKEAAPEGLGLRWVPLAGLAAITLAAGLWAGPLLRFTSEAAGQLLQPEAYIRAILGEELEGSLP